MPTESVLAKLAAYAYTERVTPLPQAVLHHAKRAIIDWCAALMPGGQLPPATLLTEALAEDLGRGPARLYPSGERATLRAAALINGTASHTVEFDDIFRDAIYHPGCPVIAAALAAAQAQRSSGELLLRAIVVGYEISTRIGVALGPAHYRYWHTTGTVGGFGAAAAVGTVLQLDRRQLAHALATVGTFAAGLQQAFRSDSMSKPLHAGRAAEAGALAALAAARGVTGTEDILEGERGLGNATSGSCNWHAATEGLGSQYNITQITLKNHGCCGHTFAAIDGILALRRAHELQPSMVDRIEVATYRTALDVTGNARPQTAFEAKFSLPYVVCTALVHGSVRLDAFSVTRLNDPETRRLMSRVKLRVDPDLDSRFPGQRAAHVSVLTVDGRELEYTQPTRRGDPDAPLSDHDLNSKYSELAGPVLGPELAGRLLESLWNLDRADVVDLALGW
jgi:2-methylcitrate dehydratase PrpD